VRFISDHKARFGVEPICRVLTEHGCPIAPSTYYDAVRRGPSARHSCSISRPVGTTRPDSSTNSASTARFFGPPTAISRPSLIACTGPSRRTSNTLPPAEGGQSADTQA
jgi:hypothetical protein